MKDWAKYSPYYSGIYLKRTSLEDEHFENGLSLDETSMINLMLRWRNILNESLVVEIPQFKMEGMHFGNEIVLIRLIRVKIGFIEAVQKQTKGKCDWATGSMSATGTEDPCIV